MMKLLYAIAAAAALLAGAMPAPAQAPQPPLQQRLREACRALRPLDLRRIPAPRDMTGLDYHGEARTGAPAPSAGHAGPAIRLLMHHSGPGPMPSSSVLAWQEADGRWSVSRVVHAPRGDSSQMPLPWPHEAGIVVVGLPRSDWTIAAGSLSPADSADLETILASRCLAREPALRPLELPMRSGRDQVCHWHPTSYHLELAGRGAARGYTRHCNAYQGRNGAETTVWASDLIVDLLSDAPLAPPARAAAPREANEIPVAFHGRWAQLPEDCGAAGKISLDIGPSAFDPGSGASAVRSVDVRGARTAIVRAFGPGFMPGLDPQEFELPLLLSPAGDRLAVPEVFGGWLLRLQRCPAA